MMNTLLTMNDFYAGMIIKFFAYSLFGWCLECIVIHHEKGIWENRGFTKLPFCIIYGFGGTLCYMLFSPLRNNVFLLFITGALAATMFEFFVAKLLIFMFDNVWWNYSNHKFQYKGILCLQSTVGWGFLTLFIVFFLDKFFHEVITAVPYIAIRGISIILVIVYALDFGRSFYMAMQDKGYINSKENN